jgi:hypothetical protein
LDLRSCGFGGVAVVGLDQSSTVGVGAVMVVLVIRRSGKSVVDISVGILVAIVVVLSRITARGVERAEGRRRRVRDWL